MAIWIGGLISVALGVASLAEATRRLCVLRGREWKSTVAVVVVSKRIREQSIDRALLTYEFVIDGHRYRSSQVAADGSDGIQVGFETAIKYRPGDSVCVYYDARDPKTTCLRTGDLQNIPFLLLCGTFMTGAGSYLLWTA